MMEEVGAYPHNMSNSSPVIWGDLVFVSTSNGQDESHVHIPSPKAPAIIAMNKTTGKLVWEDNSVEDRILHGQWSTPSVGKIGGVDQVVSAQGDGWVRGYEAATGKKLWEFDTNPKDSVWPKTRNEVIGTPVIYEDKVYIANGQDPEHGEGVGHLYCIDATKRGDITQTGRVWQYDKIRRTISTASIADGLLYIPDFSGFLHCLDAKTGQVYWTHDLFAAVWGSTLVVDGKVYLGDEDGDVVDPAGGQGQEGHRRDQHGQRRLRDAGPGARRALPEQPQPAVRAGGQWASRRDRPRPQDRPRSSRRHGRRSRFALSSFVILRGLRGLEPCAVGSRAPARLAAVPRRRAADRRRHRRAARQADPEVDLRSRRHHRVVGRDRRRASSTSARATAICWRSISRRASCAGSTRPAARSANRRRPSAAGASSSATSPGIVHAVDARRRLAARGRSRPAAR